MGYPRNVTDEVILTIDVGTTHIKGAAFNQQGRLVAYAKSKVIPKVSGVGFLEFDSDQWWRDVCNITKTLVKQVRSNSIDAVAVTGQMTSPVWLDHNRKAIRSAISYQDTRTDADSSGILGLASGIDYSASKLFPILSWLKKNEPDVANRIEFVLDVKEYIGFRLSNIVSHEPEWETEKEVIGLADKFGVPHDWFGEMHPEVGVLGEVSRIASHETGLRAGTPVMIGPGDGICAITGTGTLEPSLATDIAGMTEIVACVSDRKTNHYSVRHCVPGYWINYKFEPLGIAHQWGASLFGGSYYEMERLAKSTRPSGELGFVPKMDSIGGIVFGLRRDHARADLARAVLEGICFEVRSLLESQEKEGAAIKAVVLGGGGGRSIFWAQMRADITGRSYIIPEVSELTSLGMAVIGFVGLGCFKNFTVANKAMLRTKRVVISQKGTNKQYSKSYSGYEDVAQRMSRRL